MRRSDISTTIFDVPPQATAVATATARAAGPVMGPARTAAVDPLTPTIFHEPWWLDIVSGGRWREARIERDGRLLARMPYIESRNRLGFTMLRPPPLCHALGPAFAADVPADPSARSLRRFTLTAELIAQLPAASHSWFRLHRGLTDSIAFDGAGFASAVDFTTEIAAAAPETIWRGMRDKTRNVIRRAEQALTVTRHTDPRGFVAFYEANLRARGKRNHRPARMLENLIAAALTRGTGRLLLAHDRHGDPAAGIFTVWNGEQEHYLLSTRNARAGNGGIALLMWQAIQSAARAGRTFDTDGLRVGENHLLVTGLGGIIRPRLAVERLSLGYRALQLGFAVFGMARSH